MSCSDHEAKWTLVCVDPSLCLACTMSQLGDQEELILRKRQLLAKILEALQGVAKKDVVQFFSDECQMTLLFQGMLLEMTFGDDEQLAFLATECTLYLVIGLQNNDFELELLNTIFENLQETSRRKNMSAGLNLLNQVMQISPCILENIASSAPMQHLLISAFEDGSVTVKSTVVEICQHLYGSVPNLLDCHSVQLSLSRIVMSTLSSNESQVLQLRTLGLLSVLLKNEVVTFKMLQLQIETLTFPLMLRKLLMIKETTLQASVVQCITQIITSHQNSHSYARFLMENDVVEFVYEALTTLNEKLLQLVFTCVTAFSKCDSFFVDNHGFYGIEAVVRGTDYLLHIKNWEVGKLGLQLITIILEGHWRSSSTLGTKLSTDLLYNHLSTLVETSFKCSRLIPSAVFLLMALLRRCYLPHPVPLSSLEDNLKQCRDWLKSVLKPGKGNAAELIAGLGVVVSCLSLVKDCVGDCTVQEDAYTHPDVPDVTPQNGTLFKLSDLTDYALDLLDFLLPFSVVLKTQSIECELYDVLFRALCAAYALDTSNGGSLNMINFSKKILSSQFFNFLLKSRNLEQNTNSSEDPNDHLCTKFMQLFFYHMLHAEPDLDPNSYKEIINDGCVVLGFENDDDILLGPNMAQHFSWLYLHYVQFRYGRGDAAVVSSPFVCYLTENHRSLNEMSMFHRKICLFILAVVSLHLEEDQKLNECNQDVLRSLSGIGDLSMVYSHHPIFLKWCFSTPDHKELLGTMAIAEWIKQATDVTDCRIFFTEMNDNEFVSQCFWEMFEDENTDGIIVGGTFLKSALMQYELFSDQDFEAVATQVHLFLPEILLRNLLKQNGQEHSDLSISLLLKLLCWCRKHEISTYSVETELKIAFQLCRILSKRDTLSGDLIADILMYLSNSVKIFTEKTDGRGVSIIVNNIETLAIIRETVQSSVDSDLLIPVLSLIVHLVFSCIKLEIKHQHDPIVLNWSVINRWLSNQESKEQKLALLLLSGTFAASKLKQPLVQISLPNTGRGAQLDDHSQQILTTFTAVLNILAKQNAFCDSEATTCILSMIRGVNSILEKHMTTSPWWRILFCSRKPDENTDRLQSAIKNDN